MDLNAFYELQSRLQSGTVAGAALAADDFRLKRALEAMVPLEGAAPVFKKLCQLTRAFLAPDCPDRAGALLDALSLADAIACTQGAVAVPGEVEEITLYSRGKAVTSAPYSLLSPLLDALTNSGGGRYGYVVEMHSQRPELFADYRVRDALVKALGASYSDLAQKAEEWLSLEDESILPLLQEGFDPRGKKEMVRRVHVMEAIAGKKANGYYLSQLPEAEKEVRTALIYALRHDPDNAGKLAELCKTERGKNKDAAHWALAGLDTPEASAYWDALAEKKPVQAAEYMTLSTTGKSGEIVAAALSERLAPYERDSQSPLSWAQREELQTLLLALPGKSGPAICEVYRRMAGLGTALDEKNVERAPGNKPVSLRLAVNTANRPNFYPFSRAVPEILRQSLLFAPAADLALLSEELEKAWPGRFTAAFITAALLFRSSEEVWGLLKPALEPSILPFGKKNRQAARQALRDALESVCWDGERNCPAVWRPCRDPFANDAIPVRTVRSPLREPLDGRIYEALLRQFDQFDSLLISLIPTVQDQGFRDRIGEKLYRAASSTVLSREQRARYLWGMKECGWERCEGLAVQFCRSQEVTFWELEGFLSRMPGDAAARLAEAEQVYALAAGGDFKFRGSSQRKRELFLDPLQKYIDSLKSHVQRS